MFGHVQKEVRVTKLLRIALGAALLAAVGTGCVTSGTYDALQAQHDALQKEKGQLEQQVAGLRTQVAALEDRLAVKQKEVESLGQTHDQLVSELRSELASGQIEIQKIVDGVRLNVSDELLFPSGAVDLNDAGRDLVGRVAAQLQSEESIIFVEGHTDNVGIGKGLRARFPTNWELAGARAAVVVRVLSESGVAPERLRAVSRGPFAPIASNDDGKGRARNRRTEIILRKLPQS